MKRRDPRRGTSISKVRLLEMVGLYKCGWGPRTSHLKCEVSGHWTGGLGPLSWGQRGKVGAWLGTQRCSLSTAGLAWGDPYTASHPLASVHQLEAGSIGCCRRCLGQDSSGSICLPPGGGPPVLASSPPWKPHSAQAEEEEEVLPGSGEAGGQVEASPW